MRSPNKGKFHTLQIKFDKDYLNELTEDSDSGVSKLNCKYHIALHPAQFTDFGQSIKDELGRKLGDYDAIFQGIMLGYEKVNLNADLGVIGIDNCYVHVDIQADFFVFRPEIGMTLKGIVTRTTKDHVGCLVYSTFNISLPKPEEDDYWLGNRASIQSEVLFKIIYVDLGAPLPYIIGKLLSIVNDNTSKEKCKKLNKKINFENHDEEENMSFSPKSKKKHKKVHGMGDESWEVIQMNGEIMEERKVTGKRKRASLENNEDALVSPVSKKKHKKKNKDVELMENLEINYEEFDVVENEIKLEDNGEEDYSSTKTKKKRKKSHREFDSNEKLELNYEEFDVVENEIKLEDNREEDYSSTKTKKKRKKSHREFDSNEKLELNYEEINVGENEMKLEDNRDEDDHSSTNTKKKRKKSHIDFDSMEKLAMNYEEFQIEENKIKIEDNHVEELTTRSKKKRKERYNRGEESMENLERNNGELAEEDNKSKIEENYKEDGYSARKAKKERRKSHNRNNVAEELVLDENETKFEDNYEEDLTTKTKKKRKISHKTEFPENLEIKDEEFKIDIDEIKLEDHYKVDDNSMPETKKNQKKTLSKENQSVDNVEMTVEDLVREAMEKQNKKHKKKTRNLDRDDEVLKKRDKRREKKKRQIEDEKDMKSLDIKYLFDHSSISLQSNVSQSHAIEETTPKSKDKRKLDNVQIKEEKHDDYWDSTDAKKHSRKENRHKVENADEEVLSKMKKRREKKEKQELDDSLESLDVKALFDGRTISLNSSYSQTMANDEDRGKRRRKSKSVSEEVYLDNVKLEEDSELERIISKTNRKRSKSVPR